MASFGSQIKQFEEKAGKNITTVIRKTAFDLSKQVIEETPVDTGRAKGNWLPSIGSPDSRVIDVVTESAAIEKVRDSVSGINGDVSYFLTNSLPYIRKLEYEGHSPQQKTGWVRLAMQRADEIVKKATAQL